MTTPSEPNNEILVRARSFQNDCQSLFVQILSDNREERECILLKNDGNPISLQEHASKETTYPKNDKNESLTF